MADPQQPAPIDYDAVAKQYGAVASTPIDYDAVAKQYGAVSSSPVDYNALAKKYGAISSTPAPAPAAPPKPDPLQGQVRPAPDPTVWQRITQAVTAGIPRYSSRTVYNPKFGQMQLVSPEEAMTPAEQQRHPILTGTGELAGGLTSPESVALLAGTAGLGELPGAAAMLPRLMSAGFGAQAIYSAAKTYPEIRDAIARNDAPETLRLLTHAVGNLAMAALATQHAATGEPAVSGKTNPAVSVEPRSTVQDVPVSPTSPVGELLHDPSQAPHVRVVDSSAAARDLLEKDTVLRPVVEMPSEIKDPALATIEAQTRGRAAEMAKKYAITPVPADAQARTTGPTDIAAFRLPAARVVKDSYVPVVASDEILAQNIQSLIDNAAELRRAGIDVATIKTPQDVDAVLQIASDHVRSNLDPRAAATITFESQKQLAADLGMRVEDLLSRRAGQAFNAEQTIAARALLNQSAKNVVRLSKIAADRGDEPSLTAATTAIAQHQAIQEKVAGVTAEAGRSLGSYRIDDASLPQVKLANVLSKLPKEAQAKAAQLLSKIDPSDARQVNEFIEKIRPSSTGDKIFEYYRNALLSSPKTVTVKAASEGSMMALEATKKVVAAGLSRVKDTTPERFASESWWYAKGAIQALQHTKAILTGEFDLRDAPGFEGTGRQAIKGPFGTIVRFPGTVLARQTNLMYVLNYTGEINALAARAAIKEGLTGEQLHGRQEYLAANPTPEMSEAAHEVSLHNTFQSELGKFGRIVQGGIRNEPTGTLKYLFPFTKVPINLVKASAEFSPYGLIKGSLKGDVDAQARGLIGSSLAAGIAYLALNGLVTGGGSVDWHKKQTQEAAGFQPYSIKIGDRYYAYNRFEPLGLTFGLVADALHSTKNGDPEIVSQSKADNAVTHIERNLSDLPFLFQLSSIVDAIKDTSGRRVDSFIARQIASFIPAAVSNVAEGTDRTIRHPQGNTLAETVEQTAESRLPGLTQNVPAVIDVTGKPAQRPASQLGGANPFPFTTARHDPVVDELARLGISTPQPPKQVGKITLTDNEKQQLIQQENRELYQTLAESIQNGSWAQRTDVQKRQAITEFHRQQDRERAGRLNAMRKQTQDDLARSSL